MTELRLKLGESENQLLTAKEVNNSSNIQIVALKKNLEDAQVRIQESNKLIASNQEVSLLKFPLTIISIIFIIIAINYHGIYNTFWSYLN